MTTSLDVATLIDYAVSHALTLGRYDSVNAHEPKSKPGAGITCAIWVDRFAPIDERSGLATTSVLVTLSVRSYSSMLAEPQDMIDVNLTGAVDALMRSYVGDFTVTNPAGVAVASVDVLGAYGDPLGGQAGYLDVDGKLYRVFTITLPLIVDDLWDQVS
jgi:hypothetical protein